MGEFGSAVNFTTSMVGSKWQYTRSLAPFQTEIVERSGNSIWDLELLSFDETWDLYGK